MKRNKIIIEVRPEKHELPLLGIVEFYFQRKIETLQLFIDGKLYKTVTGSEAETLFFALENEEGTLTKEIIVSIAAKTCRQDLDEVCGRCKKTEVVFARYLAMLAMNKYLHISPTDCARKFGLEHSVFYHAKDRIAGKNKYLTSIETVWIENFNNEIATWADEKETENKTV